MSNGSWRKPCRNMIRTHKDFGIDLINQWSKYFSFCHILLFSIFLNIQIILSMKELGYEIAKRKISSVSSYRYKLCLAVFCASTGPQIHDERQKHRVVCVLQITERFTIRDVSLKRLHRDTKKGSKPWAEYEGEKCIPDFQNHLLSMLTWVKWWWKKNRANMARDA